MIENLLMIAFKKVHLLHYPFIFKWLEETHVKEWWDNSPEHKADILNFMQGRSQLSSYFEGHPTYFMVKKI